MQLFILPLIIGVIAVPPPGPSRDTLADFARIQKALNQEVYIRDASGGERVVSILDAGTDAVSVAVGRQSSILHRDQILAVDRIRDGNTDGLLKGAVVGLLVGAAAYSALGGDDARHLLRGAVTYGAIGYLFDRSHTNREPLYRAP